MHYHLPHTNLQDEEKKGVPGRNENKKDLLEVSTEMEIVVENSPYRKRNIHKQAFLGWKRMVGELWPERSKTMYWKHGRRY